jgi:hypothetical protein
MTAKKNQMAAAILQDCQTSRKLFSANTVFKATTFSRN